MTVLSNLCQAVRVADSPLLITGGGSRVYPYASLSDLKELSLSSYSGIIEYFPEELVVRVKSGTRLDELIASLSEQGQMLGSEPPAHSELSTIGGAVAAGLSGSRRPYCGATRDFVLGVGLILKAGDYAEFGGQVMKNVAGYDVARLVCGSFGILGPIADISLKVLPKPEVERMVVLEMSLESAFGLMSRLRHRVSGVSACAYHEGRLRVRVSGRETAVQREVAQLGGDLSEDGFWRDLDSLQLAIFQGRDVWCLSTDPQEPVVPEFQLLDWGFARRWMFDPQEDPRKGYRGVGHWTRVRCPEGAFDAEVFQPVSQVQLDLMRSLKQAFDPEGVFNPNRLYQGV